MITPYLRTISILPASLIALGALFVTPGFAAAPAGSAGQGQIVQVNSAGQAAIAELLALKDTFSVGERKLAGGLALSSRQAHGKTLGPAANFVNKTMSAATATTISVPVVIRGTASKDLLGYIAAHGGTVRAVAPSNDRIEASMPVAELEALATRSDVGSVRPPPQVKLNTGSLCTQGYVSHRAKATVENKGVTGNGVKVGILSDSALPAQVSALQSSGDLGPNTTVLPGAAGPDDGTNEGAAMMEIVQDLAPRAQLFFATAFISESQFAANVIALQANGCSVIGDDVSYSDDDPFQDGPLAQAVNTVVANGAIYFSSAANSGDLTNGSSSTWEGDFTDGPTITCIPCGGQQVVLHDFGGGNTGNIIVSGSDTIDLFWADPLGASTNNYDLFILDNSGSVVKGMAFGQSGSDPYLEVSTSDNNYSFPQVGDMIVIARSIGSQPVAMHVETFRESTLLFATTGSTHGHNAGANTQSMAASFWDSAHNGTKPFNGINNPTEPFSSDGPRQIFFNPDGSAITPGNFRFSTGGGTTLQKPDFTGADGVTTRTGGEFNPFYGTSAACPHGCGIAALIKSANPGLTNTQIHNILVNTAHGVPTTGWNRDAGFGVLDAAAAIQ